MSTDPATQLRRLTIRSRGRKYYKATGPKGGRAEVIIDDDATGGPLPVDKEIRLRVRDVTAQDFGARRYHPVAPPVSDEDAQVELTARHLTSDFDRWLGYALTDLSVGSTRTKAIRTVLTYTGLDAQRELQRADLASRVADANADRDANRSGRSVQARYGGTCARTGRGYPAGTPITRDPDGSWHIADEVSAAATPGPVRISRGEGYGGHPHTTGDLVLHDGVWHVVCTARATYYREEGLSFGVGDDSGYVYSATLRLAAPDEYAQAQTAREAAEAATAARAARHASLREARHRVESGERPPHGTPIPAGERLLGGPTIYGGGAWFVIDDAGGWIWWMTGNSADGDTWDASNVGTCIATRIPLDVDLAAELKAAAAAGCKWGVCWH